MYNLALDRPSMLRVRAQHGGLEAQTSQLKLRRCPGYKTPASRSHLDRGPFGTSIYYIYIYILWYSNMAMEIHHA
jgi:hypothetical protein